MKNVAIVYGGYTGESIISKQSAEVVQKSIESHKDWAVYMILIGRNNWLLDLNGEQVVIDKCDFTALVGGRKLIFDVVFNAIHGDPGENGKLLGYFDMLGIPYTGCSAEVSALAFHKKFCNDLLKHYGFDSAKSIALERGKYHEATIISEIGLPCFVKPNQAGSSLGISRVEKESELSTALDLAFAEDNLVLVESLITGMEVSCGVAEIEGEIRPIAVTEIVPKSEWFDYESKYTAGGAEEITPARLNWAIYDEIMYQSVKVFKSLKCKGMIRVDYIIQDGHPYLIEVNTVPGLSEASILPKQLEHAGISLEEFFIGQIELAL